MRAESGFLKGLNPVVAVWSKLCVLALLVFGAVWTDTAGGVFEVIKDWMVFSLKWYYIGLVGLVLLFAIWLMISRFGNIRLGADDERPEFSYFSWFAMLFGAGMGIGLIFWSIAEPIYHLQDNPFIGGETGIAPGSPQAADIALRLTFFHWGLHPWAIYAVVGLTFAYFAYRKNLPLTVRSALYPLIGDRIYGPIGHAADILAILATIFGVATSLGLGVQQLTTGLHTLTGLDGLVTQTVGTNGEMVEEPAVGAMLILIACITGVATLSVVSGVGKGIKILSELNLWLSIAVLVFLIAFGPTRYLLNLFLQSVGDYAAHVLPLSFWADANMDRTWQGSWTTFYWGWWMAWAPFVGMFIARISRGRTIREFTFGVLMVPTLLAFVWLVAFGGTAMHIEIAGAGGISEAVSSNLTSALYVTFEKMDAGVIGTIAAAAATILIATYFVTSSDSGTLVVNTLLSVGDPEPPVMHRVIWGVSEGATAAVLLLAGGLSALQTASITAALPFSVVMIFMMIGLVKSLSREIPGPQYVGQGVTVHGGLDEDKEVPRRA